MKSIAIVALLALVLAFGVGPTAYAWMGGGYGHHGGYGGPWMMGDWGGGYGHGPGYGMGRGWNRGNSGAYSPGPGWMSGRGAWGRGRGGPVNNYCPGGGCW